MRKPAIVVVVSLAMASSVQANLVSNGSFENRLPTLPGNYAQIIPTADCVNDFCLTPWVTEGSGVEWLGLGYPAGLAQDGEAYVDVNLYGDDPTAGPSGIRQDLATAIGQSYTLTFQAGSATYGGRTGTGQVRVQVANIDVSFELTNNQAAVVWGEHSLNFCASETTTTLRFSNDQDENQYFAFIDNVSVEGNGPCTRNVEIDIHPNSYPNSINLCSNGTVPIAILGSATFDVHAVDIATLRFAEAAVKIVGKKDPQQLCSYEDVNGDFVDDLVCHYVTADIAGIDGESSSADVVGELLDGTAFRGADSIRTVKDSCN